MATTVALPEPTPVHSRSSRGGPPTARRCAQGLGAQRGQSVREVLFPPWRMLGLIREMRF